MNVLERLVKFYHGNKISHAYLLETNNLEKCFDDLLKVIKQIFCENDYQENCQKCNICNLIEQNYLPSLKIIETDSSSLKKEQILELKKAFSTKPVYTKENIYVIKEAEKLTDASANTMLKFLEEPEENIIGFFVTNNINNVISTIRSRCEVLKVYYPENTINVDALMTDRYEEMFNICKNYLVELKRGSGIFINRDILLCKYKEREDIKTFFKILMIIFEELLKKKLSFENEFDRFNLKELECLKLKEIQDGLQLIISTIDNLSFNGNVELLLDKFVIEMSGENV